MKVLISTTLSQGRLPGDYSWTLDGELVTPVAAECCSPDECGCGRGFPGLASARATTTAMVVDRPDLDATTLRLAVRDSLDRDGWLRRLDGKRQRELVDTHMRAIEQVCTNFSVGTVVGRDDALVWRRSAMAA